jgi:ubiquinone/menaquinone biosynthesis C-methylase UbiE
MTAKGIPDIEETYDSISSSFSVHRRDLWPPMEEFLKEADPPCTVLDIGCGTGRALKASLDRGFSVIGVDLSQNQLEEARKLVGNDVKLIKADARSIPLPDSSADRILMIAVLHHLPDRGARIEALREAKRILREGGKALISVWSWDQDRFRERHLSRIRGERQTDAEDGPLPGDFLIPWKDKVKAMRFYHLYGPGELEAEAKEAGWIVQRSYFDGKNCWIEVIKFDL